MYFTDPSFPVERRRVCHIRAVKEEVKRYKEGLDRGHTKYKILSEEEQPDGSVIIEIKKQYNTAPVGAYLD